MPTIRRSKKRAPSKLEQLEEMLPKGYSVHSYSPGDGVTRYRFFRGAPTKQTYFGPASGIFTALGFKDAYIYAQGIRG
jgi:hypothetical protein